MVKLREPFMVKPIPRAPVSQPDISPDGGRVLFTHRILNKGEDRYESSVWIAEVDGEGPRRFTFGEGNDSAPRWSPDGRNIIFLSIRKTPGEGEEKKTRLWIIPADGGEAKFLASVPKGIVGGGVFMPVWSPDGGSILFLAKDGTKGDMESRSDVKVIRKLKHKKDGIGFFPDTRVHAFTVCKDGGDPKQLTEGEFDVGAAVWSPDGERIAFVANMSEDTDYTPMQDVWVMPSEGGRPEKVVEGIATRGTTHLAWSPDGGYIAYTSMDPIDHRKLRHKYSNLWVAPSGGGEPFNLTSDFDRPVARSADASVAWGLDSETLYFLSPDRGTSHVYRVGLETPKVERVTSGRMTVQSFSLSGDGSRIAYVATDATHPPEIWVHDGSGDRRVTNLSDELVKGIPLTEPEEFWFKASDGAEVQGWIMKPAGFEEGARYPAILQIHGGPWSNFSWAFNLLFQFLSANGYAIVYANHRASTGYGEDFARITGHWGEREYEDLMDAMDHVTGNYTFVDPERLGVGGCSGGGYLTNWIVTQTDRFKAAVTVASISNWYSFYGCSDLGPCHILSFWDLADGKEPWDEAEAYFRPSPIRYVENVETPLMIIHGEDDLRCPIEQAEQLFASLMKLRKTAEFIRFPGESHANVHGMKKPSHTTEALGHTLRWFDTYLKGE